jgi:hypothetical protein
MAETYRILIRCPVSKQIMDTGMRTSGREVLNTGIYADGKVRCRFCGQVHSLEAAFADVEQDRSLGDVWRPNA